MLLAVGSASYRRSVSITKPSVRQGLAIGGNSGMQLEQDLASSHNRRNQRHDPHPMNRSVRLGASGSVHVRRRAVHQPVPCAFGWAKRSGLAVRLLACVSRASTPSRSYAILEAARVLRNAISGLGPGGCAVSAELARCGSAAATLY